MANIIDSSLDVPVSVTAGAAQDCSAYTDKCLYFFGTFVQTHQVQISPDGTEWFDEGTAVTAKGTLEITKPCLFVRLNTTAHTSGQAEVVLVGEEAQS